ncbi:oocyte zinc finger protein XlCOF6-like isoform X2 [Hippocampus zosterae]|uniref:oocyte zinc finger protein XlCOF6-like isoform X2 n=1 Tax=Hippocampus zosterae TaxID=109293 RepID=UPI00223DE83C|nr:oocyte zinc finger protein XlCOF6-like isoform X2 [Hippocampus zosterae]
MCNVKMLRELMKERLNAAAEEIFEMFERTMADYEEKLEENERREHELVATVADLRFRLHKAVQQQSRQEASSEQRREPRIKKEAESVWGGQDAERLPELLQHTPLGESQPKTDGPHCEDLQSEPDSLFAPLSDVDDITSHSSGTAHSNDERGTRKDREGNTTHRNHNEEFLCSLCDKTFYSQKGLSNHMVAHTEGEPVACSDKRYSLKHFAKRDGEKRGEGSPTEPSETNKTAEGRETDGGVDQSGLTKHPETRTRDKPFACPLCPKRFFMKHHVRRHMRSKHTREEALATGADAERSSQVPQSDPDHTPEPSESAKSSDASSHQCLQCDKKCPSHAYLVAHMVIHTGEKPFTCSVCGQSFSFRQNMLRHEKQHYGRKPFQCSVCSRRFSNRGLLLSHLSLHVGEGDLRSSDPSQRPATREVGDDVPSEADTDDVTCNSSDACYSDDGEEALRTRKKFKDGADTQQGSVSKLEEPPDMTAAPQSSWDGERLQGGGRMTAEAAGSDMDDTSDSEREKASASSLSGERFSFKVHEASGSACVENSQTRATPDSDLRRHAENPTEDSLTTDKNRHCWECKKTFATRAGLRRHMAQHTGEKPYPCPFCDKRFSLKEYLSRHTMIHTGWNCPVCGDSFLKRSDFARHMTTHAVENPARSENATHAVENPARSESATHAVENPARSENATHAVENPARSENATQIVANPARSESAAHAVENPARSESAKHAVEKPVRSNKRVKKRSKKQIKCPICGKSFMDKSYITSHMRIHTGEKPFQCSLCLKRFCFKYRIKKHKCCGDNKSTPEEAGRPTANEMTM